MTPEERQHHVLALAKRVELLALVPSGMLARLRAGTQLPPPSEELDLHIRIATGSAKTKEGFIGAITISVLVQRKQAPRPFARFVYRVNAHYRGNGDAPDEALAAFIETNGLVHVWPYARAWIQTTSSTMGMTPVLLPFYRVQAPNAVKMEPEPKSPRK